MLNFVPKNASLRSCYSDISVLLFDKQRRIVRIYPTSIKRKEDHKLALCKVQYLSQMRDEIAVRHVDWNVFAFANVYWTEICDGVIKKILTSTLSETKGREKKRIIWDVFMTPYFFSKTFQIWTEISWKSWKIITWRKICKQIDVCTKIWNTRINSSLLE